MTHTCAISACISKREKALPFVLLVNSRFIMPLSSSFPLPLLSICNAHQCIENSNYDFN